MTYIMPVNDEHHACQWRIAGQARNDVHHARQRRIAGQARNDEHIA